MSDIKNKIKELISQNKTDEEIVSELSQGTNQAKPENKVIWQNPPKTVKPVSYYNKNSGFKKWREKGKKGSGRDRKSGQFYSD